MEVSVRDLAALLGGTVEGNAEGKLSNLAKIEDGKEGDLAFLSNMKYEHFLYHTKATAVLVQADFKPNQPIKPALIKVANPYAAFTQILEEVGKALHIEKIGVEQPSYIAESATVGPDVYIGAFAYIGRDVRLANGVKVFPHAYIGEGSIIGENTIVYPHATVYHGTIIGARCILHSGAVIGADGFGHAPLADGSYRKIPQLGITVIEDDVEIGANTTVDRATMGETRVRKGTKLDNLVQVAHNVEIGEHVVIAAQAGISGSAKIGNMVQIGGQVGVSGHLRIADKTRIGAKSGIMSDIKEEGQTLLGAPVMDHRLFFKVQALLRKLPEMEYRLRAVEKSVDED